MKTTLNLLKATGKQILEFRKSLGMNQSAFWKKIGVTQSGGSRYESGRTIPAPTRIALDLAYGSDPIGSLINLRGIKTDGADSIAIRSGDTVITRTEMTAQLESASSHA